MIPRRPPVLWHWLWGGFALLLLPARLAVGDGHGALLVAAQASGGWLLGFVVPSYRWVRVGLWVALLALAALATSERAVSYVAWLDSGPGEGLFRRFSRNEITGEGVRAWTVPKDTTTLRLEADLELVGVPGGWNWARSNTGIEIAPIEDGAAARIRVPRGGDPYLMKVFRDEDLAGRRFRATVEVRAGSSPPPDPLAGGCRGLWLQVWGPGGGARCSPVDPGPSWRRVAVEWVVPREAQAESLRVVLNDFDGATLDLRDPRLDEWVDGGWQPRGPLLPGPPKLTIAWRTGGFTSHLLPDDLGRTEIQLDLTPPTTPNLVTVRLDSGAPDGGSRLAVRRFALSAGAGADDTATVRPKSLLGRQTLGFAHPNLAGHSVAVVGIGLLALTAAPIPATAAGGLALALVTVTASRAAMLATVLGIAALVALRVRLRRTAWFVVGTLVLAGVVVVLLAIPYSPALQRLAMQGGITNEPRTAIWSSAVEALRSRPLRGLGSAPEAFARHWSEHGLGAERVAHAHNAWLHYAAVYGLPGLAATVWWSGVLALVAWRRWGGRGVVVVATVYLLNLFDTTLFHTGVLAPLLAFACAGPASPGTASKGVAP